MRMHTRIEKLEATLRVDECLSEEQIIRNFLNYLSALENPRTRAAAKRNPLELNVSHETLKQMESILKSTPGDLSDEMMLQAIKNR